MPRSSRLGLQRPETHSDPTKGEAMQDSDDVTTGKKLSRRDVLAAGGAAAGALALGADPVRAATTAPYRRRAPARVNVKMFVFLGGALEVMPRRFKDWYESRNRNVTIDIYANSNTVGYPLMVAAKRQDPT